MNLGLALKIIASRLAVFCGSEEALHVRYRRVDSKIKPNLSRLESDQSLRSARLLTFVILFP